MTTYFTDGKRTVAIDLKTWDGRGYGPDFSADFYDVGALENVGDRGGTPIYKVDDIDYPIDYAQDMIDGSGDFDAPNPDVNLFVEEVRSIADDD